MRRKLTKHLSASISGFSGRIESGFTLIELMVTVSLLALLVLLAAPALSTYTQNSRLRAVSESFLASLQTARTEAIRTNQDVEFVLTTDNPVAANVGTSLQSASAGNWIVRRSEGTATPTYTFIEGKSVLEGSGAQATSTVLVSAKVGSVDTPVVTFKSIGNTTLGAQWQVDFKSANGACAAAGPIRCLRIVVSASGQIRSCDPIATSPDSRAC
jgi:type IV fimbrial biogenesis protein FimT